MRPVNALLLSIVAIATGNAGLGGEDLRPAGLAGRQRAWLESFAARPLPLGPNPATWVDTERWCAAHARLAAGVQTGEANAYIKAVQPVSLWHGLVADTDVQATDLLRTYFEFRDRPVLEAEAKARLIAFLRDWTVPNPDRNRLADRRYEWPCEYTENHSLNILVTAYLIDAALDRDRTLRRDLLRRFLHDRARWGWSEFNSPSYMIVTAKALACLHDFAPDPEIAKAARLHLDLLMIQYAAQCLGEWRGVPFVRGYGSQVDNSANSALHLARLWFNRGPTNAAASAPPFMAHLLTSRYAPPTFAAAWATDLRTRGSYTLRMTGVTGPGRLHVPMVMRVTPDATLASAQGWGSYYDGCYWSLSFASSPQDLVTGVPGKGRNVVQVDNVMITFGGVLWRGALKPDKEGPFTVGGSERVPVGQIDLADECHVLVMGGPDGIPDQAAMKRVLEGMKAEFRDGTVRLTLPDGRPLVMENERAGDGWRMVKASVGSEPIRIDTPYSLEAPFMRSERDSGLYQFIVDGKTVEYDLRDPLAPVVRTLSQSRLPEAPSWTWKGPGDMAFVLVPPGDFPMGSPLTEGRENERPQRWVTGPGFYIGETEVTVGQYKQFLAETPQAAPIPEWYWKEWGKTDRHAMTYVSWDDAQRFCQWLSKKSGRACRLPSEAEWEKAAQGFTHRAYPWGDTYDGSQAGTPNGTYAEVGTHPRDVSPFGARDMAGGVWEWCADAFDGGPAGGGWKSLRGCGWNFDPDTFRCAYRSGMNAQSRAVHIGFRVVAGEGM